MDFAAPFVAKAGDPIKGMGAFTCVCGTCPFIVSIVFMGVYASLYAFTDSYNGYAEDLSDALGT